jgi:hypothetical protein
VSAGRSSRLGVDAQVSGAVDDRAFALERQTNASLDQL